MENLRVNNKRNLYLDCSKGIGIVLVVMWHCHLALRSIFTIFYFNLFFFLLAGLMIKTDKIISIKSLFSYLKKIINRYAKPYVLFNLIFLCCYNFFVKYHIITNDYRYNCIPHILTCNELLHKAIYHILVISRSELLCGATWFLKSLFWGLLSFSIITFIYNKVCNFSCFDILKKYKKIATYAILSFIIALLIHYINNRNLFFFCQTLICIFIGDLLKPYIINIKQNNIIFVLSIFFGLACTRILFRIPAIICLSVLSFLFLYQLSMIIQKISQTIFNLFVYLGQNTIPILVFHFLGFKFVTFLYVKIYHLSIDTLGAWPIIFNANGTEISILWRFIYLIVGILFSITVLQVYSYFSKIITSTINNKFVKNESTQTL